jgi:P-type Ca2+ transporter type 2C
MARLRTAALPVQRDKEERMDPASPPAPAATSSSAPAWHTLDATAAATRLLSTSTGLTAAEAAQRLVTHGPNELRVQTRESAWRTLAAQFQNVLIVILLCATIVSGFLGHTVEAVAITVIVLFAVLLGFFQEYRASRALDALREMAAPAAHVLRDGVEVTVPARELVPGDVVQLRAGDRVPADLRLIEAVNLAVDEAALTGESTPAQKITGAIGDATLSLGDRRNMAYAGTIAMYGRGQGLVVATGMATEFGHIARLVESVESSRTPLQINLDRLGATLGKAAMAVVALVVVVGLARGLPMLDMFMFGIALASRSSPRRCPPW